MAGDARVRMVDLANRLGEKFLRFLDRYFARASLVGNHDFFDQGDFPWTKRVEACWPAIRASPR